jgi:hypothetical protein
MLDTGIVDEDIAAAEAGDGQGHHFSDRFRRQHVGR